MLVTGANGFVGGHLTELLVKRGYRVRAMVRNPEKSRDSLPKEVETVVGTMQDRESIRRAVEGVYGVFHIAAVFREAGLPDEYYFEVNAEGTRRVFEASIEAGVKRIIHCSTTGVLGDVKNPPADETVPYAPCDIYQESKVEAEKIALEYFRREAVRGVVIRPAMIYGPRDTRLLKIFRMINRGKFFYVGRGDAFCHFIDVRDLAKAFLLAMEKENLNGEVYTIAGDEIIRLNEVVDKIADILHVKRPWLHLPLKPMQWLGDICEAICTPLKIQPPIYRRRVDFYIKNRSFDISKAKRDLGFKSSQPFELELKEIIQWYKERSLL